MPSPRAFERISPGTIRARAFAKLNLALAVGPPIPEGMPGAGYHPIASWMHAIDLADEILIEQNRHTRYNLIGTEQSPVDWVVESDLGVRAHRVIENLAGRALPVKLTITKHIPSGGGVGGGSADAAAVMFSLRDLFGLALSDGELTDAAHALGTDIPFFLDHHAWQAGQAPRPALVSGLGDRIERLERRGDPVELICPGYGCDTGAVYRAFDEHPTRSCDEEAVRAAANASPFEAGLLFNDLSDAASRVEPRLETLRAGLAAKLCLSGSGSTMFRIGDEPLKGELPDGVRVIQTRLI